MREFTLKKREEDYLKLNIGEESFLIPLATNLTLDEVENMDSTDGAIEFFRRYIREDVAQSLTLYNYKDIITAWREASEKAMESAGKTVGES